MGVGITYKSFKQKSIETKLIFMFLFREFSLKPKKEMRSALLDIYGVSWRKSIYVVSKAAISYPFFLKNISNYHFTLIFFLLKGLVISDTRIKRRINYNIHLAINNGSYVGIRHKLCLSVRGQRTRTNCNTQRSKRLKNMIIRKFKR